MIALPRRLTKLLGWLILLFLVGGALAFSGAFLATQYIFQEPAFVTWSRLLKPEVQWQRQKYPSARFVFDILEKVLVKEDPRDRFGPTGDRPPPSEPSLWTADFVGPRVSDAALSQAREGDLVLVQQADELKRALRTVRPGTTILLRPGRYRFSGRSIVIDRPGDPAHPILLRAAALGDVTLQFDLLEGFHVRAPHWVFENLIIEGVCRKEGRCEHAFHIVGKARGTVLRNNWITNFNSAVKVNAARGSVPDDGLIEHNLFINEGPRDTSSPVTPLDIVAVSAWRVRKNVIADFAKRQGNRTSYGAFFKGAGSGNVFEQNLVRCEWRHRGGIRVGFSFGGGGTSQRACRNARCDAEQQDGILRSNIIMNCPNDVGVYLNKSAGTLIHNNLIINTRGVDVRFAESDAVIVNNVIDGRVLARDGGSFSADRNIMDALDALLLRKSSADLYADPARGDFRLRDLDRILGKGLSLENAGADLCDQPYSRGLTDIGPIQYGLAMTCTPVLP